MWVPFSFVLQPPAICNSYPQTLRWTESSQRWCRVFILFYFFSLDVDFRMLVTLVPKRWKKGFISYFLFSVQSVQKKIIGYIEIILLGFGTRNKYIFIPRGRQSRLYLSFRHVFWGVVRNLWVWLRNKIWVEWEGKEKDSSSRFSLLLLETMLLIGMEG